MHRSSHQGAPHVGCYRATVPGQDVDGFACLVCPNHGWAYEILEESALSGRCTTRPGVVQPMYPVREGADGKLLGRSLGRALSLILYMYVYENVCRGVSFDCPQLDSKRSPAKYLRTMTFESPRKKLMTPRRTVCMCTARALCSLYSHQHYQAVLSGILGLCQDCTVRVQADNSYKY